MRRERLHAGAPETLTDKMRKASATGERKPVTALFADVVGSTAILERIDAEDWSEIMNRGFRIMSDAVFRYEGTIAHLMGDGLLAFFGAPVAHEDDPERAIRSALDMLANLTTLADEVHGEFGIDYQIRVGINTGPVIVGPVGSDLRYEYTALGDAVNIAARLQAAARPGSLLVTAATRHLAGETFEYMDAGELTLRGKSDVVQAYEVVAARGSVRARGIPGLSSPMLGRDDNLKTLRDAVARLAAGRSEVVFVTGEAGIGKTRLVHELRKTTPGQAVMWIEGRAVSYARSLPYRMIGELVHGLERLSGAGLTASLEREALDHLLAASVAEAEQTHLAGLDPEALRTRYVEAVVRFLVLAAEQGPLVVLCEDVHWADPASVEVLRRVFEAATDLPILFLCTTREDKDTHGWSLFQRPPPGVAVTAVRVTPLEEDDARGMVAFLLEIESLPATMREAILARAAGNPFFVEEIVRMMIDRGAIRRSGGTWVASETATQLEIPETIHGLLLSRIDRLPKSSRSVLKVASILGRSFHQQDIDEVVAQLWQSRTSAESIDVLIDAGLIVRATDAEYWFRHVLIQEAAYESVLRQDRRKIHGVVAEVLEQRLPGAERGLSGLVALHYERAGRGDRALPHLLAAGRHAQDTFANVEAHEFFSRMEPYLTDSTEPAMLRLRVQAGLGRAMSGGTFIPAGEVIDILENLLPLAEQLGDMALQGEIHYWIARYRHSHGEVANFSPLLRRSIDTALEIAEALDDVKLKVRPLALLGESKFVACDFKGAAAVFEQAVPLLEEQGSLAEASFWSGWTALSYARLGDFEAAERWTARIPPLAEKSRDPNTVLDANLHIGMVETLRGNFEEATVLVRKGIELAEKIDNKACLLVGLYVEGDQRLQMGRPDEAVGALERGADVAQYCNVADVENLSRAMLTLARSQLGSAEQSLSALDASLLKAREIGDLLGEAEILRARGLVRATVHPDEWEAVQTDFEEAIALFTKIETRPYLARALRDFGLALESAGRLFGGKEKLEQAEQLFKSMGIESGSARTSAGGGS